MKQDFIDIECNASELYTETSVNTVQSCSETYTVNEIAQRLAVSVRSIYSYANKLIEIWNWEPETTWRKDGRYTAKALSEMEKMKSCKNISEYADSVTRATGNYTSKANALACVETRQTTQTITARPIPQLPTIINRSTDVSAIRERTQKMREINVQLSDAITQLVTQKVDNKIEELDARLDDLFTEIETVAQAKAIERLQQNR
ncbi:MULTISPECIES: hypothetical protein [Scytonema]